MNQVETRQHAKDLNRVKNQIMRDNLKRLPERVTIAERLLNEGYKRLMDDLKSSQDNYNSRWYRRLYDRIFG